VVFVNKPNDIAKREEKQAFAYAQRLFAQQIDQMITARLPSDLEESARKYGVMVRKREIKSAFGLIRMLIACAVSGISQRMMATLGFILNIADISDQAWQKKMVKCEAWLTHILAETVPVTKAAAGENLGFAGRQIEVVDRTTVKQYGTGGEVRIHMSHSLTAGSMSEVVVTDQHTAESLTLFNMSPGSIYLADAGYGTGKNYEHVVSARADALLRVTPSNIRLTEDAAGKRKIDMTQKLDTRETVVEFIGFVHSERRRYLPTRVIAIRLPEDKVESAIYRKKRKAQKNQSLLKDETLIYAQWVILMTSLDERYSAEEILELYRSRWQVELLFKRIKQFFKVSKIKKATMQHSKVLVLLWLIVWSLIERDVIMAERYLIAKQADMRRYSVWTMSAFIAHCYKALFSFPCFYIPDALCSFDHIFKRLCNHKSNRANHSLHAPFLLPLAFSP
jgi:hypothetical protein